MQLSFHADYACRVLMYLAAKDSRRASPTARTADGEQPFSKASIEEIATAFGISENHLVKVVHRLGQLGFIVTTRGRGGGICLARASESISVGDVVRKMEPHFDVVECFNQETNTCPIIKICGLKASLMQAREAFFAVLDDVSIAQVTLNRKALGAVLLHKPQAD